MDTYDAYDREDILLDEYYGTNQIMNFDDWVSQKNKNMMLCQDCGPRYVTPRPLKGRQGPHPETWECQCEECHATRAARSKRPPEGRKPEKREAPPPVNTPPPPAEEKKEESHRQYLFN